MTLQFVNGVRGVPAVLGLAFLAAIACGEDRGSFEPPPPDFGPTANPDGGCPSKCSLDGRSVIRCTGEIVETCAAELACGGGRCQGQCAAMAAEGSSNGCEFYLQPPMLISNTLFSQSCYAAYVVNTSTMPVDVALEYEGKALDVSKSMFRTDAGATTLSRHSGPISPGDGVVLFVSDRVHSPGRPEEEEGYTACPSGVAVALQYDYYPTGTQFGSSFHLTTTVPVSIATIYPFGGARTFYPSATLLLPVATWAKENILINPWGFNLFWPPGAQIVASEDDTDVTIFPKRAIEDGAGVVGSPAGVPAKYRLKRGQFLQLVQAEELTGSLVVSTKPTSIFGGHTCGTVPADVGQCDILSQQIPAYEQWGAEYVGVGYRPRLGDEHEPVPYRIVGARDGTRLDYDPEIPVGAPLTLNAGEVATFASGAGDAFVVRTQDAEHPIYMAAYMSSSGGDYWASGHDFDTKGDPDFVNVVPARQYLSAASFYADPTYAETSLVIVRAKTGAAFKDVTLDCLAGPVPGFRPIGTRGDYEFTRVDLSDRGRPGVRTGDKVCYYGAHHLKSDGPFTATLWGWDTYASYAYPSGMATHKLVEAPLPR